MLSRSYTNVKEFCSNCYCSNSLYYYIKYMMAQYKNGQLLSQPLQKKPPDGPYPAAGPPDRKEKAAGGA